MALPECISRDRLPGGGTGFDSGFYLFNMPYREAGRVLSQGFTCLTGRGNDFEKGFYLPYGEGDGL